MSRLGTNPNQSSDQFEAKMLPDVEREKPDEGGVIDLKHDGVHKIYLHRAQLEIYNWQSRTTYIRAARGFGKTSYIGVHLMKCVLGLPRQLGGFVGASAKQIYTRTMPNVMKVVNSLGYEKGVFWFFGQPPARLRWERPYAEPRNWENVVSFQNGGAIQLLSMAVPGSANGLNLGYLLDDETKYQPWSRVREEVMPTVRGDTMPEQARAAAQKVEVKQWGYGTDPKMNPYWKSMLFCSDAGLTSRQCEWEKEEFRQTEESRLANEQIAKMLAELRYLEKTNPRLAVELARNEVFLRRLHLLRSQSETFWNFSSIENCAMLGESWIRDMKRNLPDLMFRIQILGQKKGAAKDGYYSNWDIDIHGYSSSDMETERLIKDKFLTVTKGRTLDAQNWPTDYETETLDFEQAQRAGENCSLDVDVDYNEPLRIAIDCNANLNCLVVGQTRLFDGRESLLAQRSMFVMNERKLRSLASDFSKFYKPHLRRCGEVIFYYTPTIKQGASTAYAVEGADEFRFDRVMVQELQAHGWKVTDIEIPVIRDKYQIINDILSGRTAPFLRVNSEAGRNDYLITAIENAGLIPGTFRKDKSREKLKSEDGIGGDVRTRTDITDALDDLLLGCKFHNSASRKIGGRLRGRFSNLVIPH